MSIKIMVTETQDKNHVGVIQSMLDSHLTICIGMPGLDGIFPLTDAEEISRYLSDPIQFIARSYGVSKATVTGYLDYKSQSSPMCMGTTRSGAPCGNDAYYSGRVTIKTFCLSNPDLYCHSHAKQAIDKKPGG